MIKEYREKSGMTQTEAAKHLRINVGFWCRVESGEVDLPPRHYKKVSSLFSIPMTKLLNARIHRFAEGLRKEVKMREPLRCDIKLKAISGPTA